MVRRVGWFTGAGTNNITAASLLATIPTEDELGRDRQTPPIFVWPSYSA
jgi:hypothetical protein